MKSRRLISSPVRPRDRTLTHIADCVVCTTAKMSDDGYGSISTKLEVSKGVRYPYETLCRGGRRRSAGMGQVEVAPAPSISSSRQRGEKRLRFRDLGKFRGR
jgi:hypothetical protein